MLDARKLLPSCSMGRRHEYRGYDSAAVPIDNSYQVEPRKCAGPKAWNRLAPIVDSPLFVISRSAFVGRFFSNQRERVVGLNFAHGSAFGHLCHRSTKGIDCVRDDSRVGG